jgi:mycothiol synthase
MNAVYTSRPFQDEADYELLRQLLIQTYPLCSPPLNPLLGEIDWWRATSDDPDQMARVRLWFEHGGALVACVWPRGEQIELIIHPAHRQLERQIVLQAAALAQPREAMRAGGQERSVQLWSYAHDHERNAILRESGYQQVEAEFLACHRLSVATAPPPGPLPDGYSVRGFAGDVELQQRVDAHRSAFYPSKMTAEKHRRVMASPTYRQELDIVCAAADGTIAACTIVWFDAVNRVGIFEPVACHADHRRRGLSGAVMREGLRRIRALGGTMAHVMSHRDDSPGAHTYRSLGFEVIGRLYQWHSHADPAVGQKSSAAT